MLFKLFLREHKHKSNARTICVTLGNSREFIITLMLMLLSNNLSSIPVEFSLAGPVVPIYNHEKGQGQ